MMRISGSPPDFSDEDFPADPYPGTRPGKSFVHYEQSGYTLTPDPAAPSGWRVNGQDLDAALNAAGAAGVGERLPVLAYGSNANPSKITWLRSELGLQGPVIVLRAQCHDISAVWSAGIRQHDGQRPAVLAGMPGAVETHAIWLVTPDQRRVLDVCEGRGERYRLVWLNAQAELESGEILRSVLAYAAHAGDNKPIHLNRLPLLFNGKLVRCLDVGQAQAVQLGGVPAESDNLIATEVHGEP